MRLHKIILLSGLLFVMLAIGCAQTTRNVETSQPTTIATLVRTITTRPTLALTPSIVPADTLTAIPILPEKEARVQLLALLADNGGCRLPCLLGITPGKTTYTEARAILLSFSGISISMKVSDDTSPDSVWLTYDEGDSRTFIQLSYLYASDGVINHIAFNAAEYEEFAGNRSLVFDSKNFGKRLSPYMLPGILSEFGKPASVVIHTSGKQITGSGGFEILLFYPDQGIFVHYITQMETVGANARGCPANAEVELELYPSDDADAFDNALSQTEWAFAWPELAENPSWKPIDKATSMSLEQFYETFRQPTDKCIETPLKGWYVPQ